MKKTLMIKYTLIKWNFLKYKIDIILMLHWYLQSFKFYFQKRHWYHIPSFEHMILWLLKWHGSKKGSLTKIIAIRQDYGGHVLGCVRCTWYHGPPKWPLFHHDRILRLVEELCNSNLFGHPNLFLFEWVGCVRMCGVS